VVTDPVRIGITGTHSTGKTLLMRRIEMELRAVGLTVARTRGLAKRAAAVGFPKMHLHTATSTEWIIATGIADELAGTVHADVVLADRATVDALAYYTAALEHRNEIGDAKTLERLETLAATQTLSYRVLFATVLDTTAPVQVGHEYDPGYRELVDRHVHQRLADQQLSHCRVTNDDSSRRAAIQRVLNAVGADA
jgi:hypothetical protein